MNKTIKMCVAAFAVSAFASVFAEGSAAKNAAENRVADLEETVVGWTPVAVGIATPVQLPWGLKRWDVYGLDFNLLYSDAPRMYGLDLSFGGCATRDKFVGVSFGGIFNYGDTDVYGLRASCGPNICNGNVYGIEIGGLGLRRNFKGIDVELIGSAQENMTGLQISGIGNLCKKQCYGASFALGANVAESLRGLQCSLIFNQVDELNGCQVSIVNIAQRCNWGLQLGLVNVILDNKVKVLPLFNCYFGGQVTR